VVVDTQELATVVAADTVVAVVVVSAAAVAADSAAVEAADSTVAAVTAADIAKPQQLTTSERLPRRQPFSFFPAEHSLHPCNAQRPTL
jgi:outer membrane receptor protein involved in Fe transport